ncbi:MAG: c-type cytochrome [Chthoniobacter sp.]|uniref:c-type cytochrome n=1 Tax=Chthoniobacter sp. TaxID=2510640 RepID=UPI0032AB868D
MKIPLPLFALLALTASLSSPARADIQTPALADLAPATMQGLTVTFSAGGKTDTRAGRLIALFVPAGEAPTPFLAPGPFTAKWEGEITSDLRAAFTFTVDTTGVVTATLNGQPLLDSRLRIAPQPAQLQKGANKLVVEFQSPPQGDAMVRLMWSSKDFPREPIPPTAFQHDTSAKDLRTGERLRAGRLLFAQNRCSACHDASAVLPPKGEGLPELAQDAPTFDAIGDKYREPWLAAWINDPHSIRPHALMPKVFAGETGRIDQRAADVAAYFASTATMKQEEQAVDDALAAQGGALFANLGCIACHTKPDADGQDEHDRVPLAHVKAKWHRNALHSYLENPAQNYAWNRMPHFRLSEKEADQLTDYLLATANREFSGAPKGDATRGAQLLATSGCLNCHANVPPTTTPALAATLQSGWTKGCLGADAPSRGKAPDFGFTPPQREALVAFAANGFASLKQDAPEEFAERQIKNLRCTACHQRDGQPSVWSQLDEEIIALQTAAPLEEGERKPIFTTALPALTWFGEKLRPAYLATFIAGHEKDKPRAWIVARMPGFATPAEGLARGLPRQHGFGPTITEPAPDPGKVKIGETLIGENGGFNCIQCHILGDRQATAVFEAPGPNLAWAPKRLRKEYFLRWALAPTRIDPDTKMPKFADEEGKTPLTDFFHGQAAEQFDAIWQYLQTFAK